MSNFNKINNKMTLLPIGTKIYSFLTHPFRVTRGKIVGHITNPVLRYECLLYDPLKKESYAERMYWVHLTEDEALAAYQQVQRAFDKMTKKS
jgi:hypothetical protein